MLNLTLTPMQALGLSLMDITVYNGDLPDLSDVSKYEIPNGTVAIRFLGDKWPYIRNGDVWEGHNNLVKEILATATDLATITLKNSILGDKSEPKVPTPEIDTKSNIEAKIKAFENAIPLPTLDLINKVDIEWDSNWSETEILEQVAKMGVMFMHKKAP